MIFVTNQGETVYIVGDSSSWGMPRQAKVKIILIRAFVIHTQTHTQKKWRWFMAVADAISASAKIDYAVTGDKAACELH